MLRRVKDERTLKENLMLASSTAFVAGMTNIAGVIAFLVFTTNVTGHVATLAKHIVEQNFHEMIIFMIWLLMFLLGTFLSNFLVRMFPQSTSRYRAHAAPIIIEIIVLFMVAFYGHHLYEETQTEREIIIGAILFSMGLQNALVSNISGGIVKTSHLTGLFTDLGGDLAELFFSNRHNSKPVKHRIYIRITILSFYVFGGLFGGYFFSRFDLAVFYVIPCILLTILYYDLSPLALHRLNRMLKWPISNNSRRKKSRVRLYK